MEIFFISSNLVLPLFQGLSWDLGVICDKNEVDNQDEWLNLGGGGVEWDLVVLCSANMEDPDILHLGVS